VEHVVVQREVAHRQHVDAGLRRLAQVLRAESPRSLLQCSRLAPSGPTVLEGGLELAVGPDAGKPQHSGSCHWMRLLCRRPSSRGSDCRSRRICDGKSTGLRARMHRIEPPSQTEWPSGEVTVSASLPLRVSSGLRPDSLTPGGANRLRGRRYRTPGRGRAGRPSQRCLAFETAGQCPLRRSTSTCVVITSGSPLPKALAKTVM